MSQYVLKQETPPEPDWEEGEMAEALGQALLIYVAPLLVRLEEVLDKRVVRTFAQTILAIVRNRERSRGLVQRELGALLEGGNQGESGSQTAENAVEQADVEECLDWGMADGGSRTRCQAVGSARDHAHCRLGWQCLGEARKSRGRGTVASRIPAKRPGAPACARAITIRRWDASACLAYSGWVWC